MTAEKAKNPARLGSFHIEVAVPGLDERHRTGILRAVKSCLIHNTLLHAPEIEIAVDTGSRTGDRPTAFGATIPPVRYPRIDYHDLNCSHPGYNRLRSRHENHTRLSFIFCLVCAGAPAQWLHYPTAQACHARRMASRTFRRPPRALPTVIPIFPAFGTSNITGLVRPKAAMICSSARNFSTSAGA